MSSLKKDIQASIRDTVETEIKAMSANLKEELVREAAEDRRALDKRVSVLEDTVSELRALPGKFQELKKRLSKNFATSEVRQDKLQAGIEALLARHPTSSAQRKHH